MGHHPENVHFAVGHARDVGHRSVGVGPRVDRTGLIAVLEQDLVVVLKGLEPIVVNEVIAFAVGNGNGDGRGWIQRAGDWCLPGDGLEGDVFANELAALVVQQCTCLLYTSDAADE